MSRRLFSPSRPTTPSPPSGFDIDPNSLGPDGASLSSALAHVAQHSPVLESTSSFAGFTPRPMATPRHSVFGASGPAVRPESLLNRLSSATLPDGLLAKKSVAIDEPDAATERTPLLGRNIASGSSQSVASAGRASDDSAPDLDDDEDEDDEGSGLVDGEDGEQSGAKDRRRGSRSRSKSQRRKLPWWKRPSPIWFLPGTLVMSISIGMILSPKMEIYTQLVCRSMPIEPAPAHNMSPLSLLFLNPPSTSTSSQTKLFSALPGDIEGEASDNDHGPEWSKQCRARPEVQKAVATLATILTLSAGLLSALTTGFWGSLSDRRGRKPILALALFGTVVMDSVFLIVVKYHDKVGYRFLLVGPAFDGLVGGMSTATAAINAYLSDCTDPGSRARIFSILGGLLFGGIALGPTLSALMISFSPSPSAILRPFYVALVLHSLYLLVIIFFIPESLSQSRQLKARERWVEEEAQRGGWRPWSFLRPLALLGVRDSASVEATPSVEADSSAAKNDSDIPVIWRGAEEGGRDATAVEIGRRRWALTKIAVAYGGYVFVIAIAAFKIQYAQFKYRWGAVENGYLLTLTGVSRMAVLVVLLPLFIRFWRKPPPVPQWEKPVVVEVGGSPLSSAISSGERERLIELADRWDKEATYLKVVHDSHFDLLLARLSVLIDLVGYGLMAFPLMTPTTFLVLTAVQSLGGGASPALQSLALAHTSPRDSGRLFASFSVLQALSAQVIGPIVFGSIFFSTVSFFPEAIFGVAALLYGLSLLALTSVRLGHRHKSSILKATRPPVPRGRSETRKPVLTSKPSNMTASSFQLRA